MTKADLINGIAEKLKYPKKTVTSIAQEVFNYIENALNLYCAVPQKWYGEWYSLEFAELVQEHLYFHILKDSM